MGIFDIFSRKEDKPRVSLDIQEQLEDIEDRINEIEDYTKAVSQRLRAHMANCGKIKERGESVEIQQTINKDMDNSDDNEDLDDSVLAYIKATGENPKTTLMRLIRKGEWI